jgi:hypothetical protein
LQFKSGWLWVKRYKGTDYCLFFWDANSETFVNVADNDKSVLINVTKKSKWKRGSVILKLFDTNKHAPGPYPFTYGGFTGRQFVTQEKGANILCYKFLNNYQFKSEAWIKAQAYKLRHHKMCNFDLLYVDYDAKKLVPKNKWKGGDDDDEKVDDKKEDEEEESGTKNEKEGKKTNKKPVDEDDAPDAKEDAPPKAVPKKAEPQKPKEPKKGELNHDFGLRVETEFYVQTYLTSNRYVDTIDKKLVIKTPNELDTQVWWFD